MTEGETSADTVASDLFFGLAAILIVILCLASQSIARAVADQAQAAAPADLVQAAQQAGLTLAVADADGVTLTASGMAPRRLGIDDIASADLGFWAARPPTVLILPDASDSAFLFDTAMARAGVTQIARLRLGSPCPAPRFVADGLICQ